MFYAGLVIGLFVTAGFAYLERNFLVTSFEKEKAVLLAKISGEAVVVKAGAKREIAKVKKKL